MASLPLFDGDAGIEPMVPSAEVAALGAALAARWGGRC
ncbi:MAG: hypothetical protein RJA99_4372, partial [Pseudomonadota bacterium]